MRSARDCPRVLMTTESRSQKGTAAPIGSAVRQASPTPADAQLVAELGRRALGQHDLQVVMDDALAIVRDRLQTEFVKILELVPSGEGFLLTAGIGWKPGYVGQVVVPLIAESYAGYTMQQGRPIIVEDLKTEKRFQGMPLLHEHGVVSGISTVLRGDTRAHGLITAHSAQQRTFTDEDVAFFDAVAGVVAAAMDRRDAEGLLEETNQRLRLTLEAGRMGAWEWNPHTGRVIWSDVVERTYGLQPGEFAGTIDHYVSFIHPEDRERVAALIQEGLRTGKIEMEYRIVRPTGEVRWLLARGLVTRDQRGEPLRMTGICYDTTDDRAAERALREAEEKYRTLFENAAFGVFQTTADGRFITANQALARILGYESPDQLIAEIHDIGVEIHVEPANRAEFARQLIEDGEVVGFESRARRRDGELIWLSLTARTRRTAEGREPYFEGIVEDVTQRKVTETRIAAQYAVTRVLAAATNVEDAVSGVLKAICETLAWKLGQFWVVNLEGSAVRCVNDYQSPGFADPEFSDASRTTDRAPGEGLPGKVWESGAPHWIDDLDENPIFRRSGAAKEAGLRSGFAFPILIEGRVIGVMEFFSTERRCADSEFLQAVSAIGSQLGQFVERKRGENERERLLGAERLAKADAQEAERQQAFLAEASAMLSSSLDYHETLASLAQLCVPFFGDWCAIDILEDGKLSSVAVVHADPAKVEYAQELRDRYPPDIERDISLRQVIGQGIAFVIPEITEEVLRQMARERGREQEIVDIILNLGLRSGIAVPMKARGRTLGVLTVITAESGRTYDAADVALAEDLGHRAGLAVDNALLYRESQQVQAELIRANEAKDEFLGMVSHELRTPITTIFGGARLLRSRGDSLDVDSRASVLADIEQESDRLHRIVEDLLVLARVELGQEVITEPILVHRIAEKCISGFTKRRSGRAIELQVCDDTPPARASAVYVEQVIRNLVNNADKYSPPDRPIDVEVSLDSGEIVTTVRDRGPGIAAEELDRIFERFYRSAGTAREAGGAGIGLTVCKRLVEAQSGRIWAERRDGGGLCVSFSLPLYE